MSLFGSVDSKFVYEVCIFAIAITVLFPTFISVFTLDTEDQINNDLLDDYYDFVGYNAPTNEQVWALTGIYTPYYSGAYGYTADGWLYGSLVGDLAPYVPEQYKNTLQSFSVQRGDDGFYRYTADTEYGDHRSGDLYTSVTMDVSHQSDIFFSEANRHEDVNGRFYYDFSGYRYAFQPLANYQTVDADGNLRDVVATTTSLSLIWYNYYGSSGISGQLIISGSDSGVAYLTAAEIVSSFSQITSTSSFKMTFNGVEMNIYIRLDPSMIAAGYTVEQCYNEGYWSIMVTSLSTDVNSYAGTDYSFNVYEIWDIIVSLLTFNADQYGLDGMTATLASLIFSLPLYAMIIAIGLNVWPMLILAGILAAIQAFSLF